LDSEGAAFSPLFERAMQSGLFLSHPERLEVAFSLHKLVLLGSWGWTPPPPCMSISNQLSASQFPDFLVVPPFSGS